MVDTIALGDGLDKGVATGELAGLHGFVLLRGEELLLERYYSGEDQSWGRPLGQVVFDPETLHDLRSVTKSIVALLYGIALAEGKVPPPEASLIAQFPHYADLAKDPARCKLTIGHVLSMTMGMVWNEDLPYSDPRNSEIAMEQAPDRYRFVLEQPIIQAPGLEWTYSGGATALLGHLLAKGTGEALPDYARRKLFDPLGVGNTGWAAGADGTPSAASGLRMKPRDLAAIGRMVLRQGQGIVPADWIAYCLTESVKMEGIFRYGRHWYLGQFPKIGPAWVAAMGNGGQRLFLVPSLDVTLAITAGNYNAEDQWVTPTRVFRDLVLPELLKT